MVEEAVQKEHGFTESARATEFLEKIVQVRSHALPELCAADMDCTTSVHPPCVLIDSLPAQWQNSAVNQVT